MNPVRVGSLTVVYLTVALCAVILVVWIVRGIYIIQPGYAGLLFRSGKFILTLPPGFSFVLPVPSTGVRTVKIGSGSNRALGLVGTARAELTPDSPLGPVDLGDRVVSARSDFVIHPGTRVGVIQDSELGNVLVAMDRLPVGTKVSNVGGAGPLGPSH